MGKLRKTFFLICAIVLYLIILAYIHAGYSYDMYWMEESDVICRATVVYCVVVAFVGFFVLASKVVSQIEKNSDDVATANLPLEKVEEPKAVDMSVEETPENKDADKDSQYIGTGVVGLERWDSYYLKSAAL